MHHETKPNDSPGFRPRPDSHRLNKPPPQPSTPTGVVGASSLKRSPGKKKPRKLSISSRSGNISRRRQETGHHHQHPATARAYTSSSSSWTSISGGPQSSSDFKQTHYPDTPLKDEYDVRLDEEHQELAMQYTNNTTNPNQHQQRNKNDGDMSRVGQQKEYKPYRPNTSSAIPSTTAKDHIQKLDTDLPPKDGPVRENFYPSHSPRRWPSRSGSVDTPLTARSSSAYGYTLRIGMDMKDVLDNQSGGDVDGYYGGGPRHLSETSSYHSSVASSCSDALSPLTQMEQGRLFATHMSPIAESRNDSRESIYSPVQQTPGLSDRSSRDSIEDAPLTPITPFYAHNHRKEVAYSIADPLRFFGDEDGESSHRDSNNIGGRDPILEMMSRDSLDHLEEALYYLPTTQYNPLENQTRPGSTPILSKPAIEQRARKETLSEMHIVTELAPDWESKLSRQANSPTPKDEAISPGEATTVAEGRSLSLGSLDSKPSETKWNKSDSVHREADLNWAGDESTGDSPVGDVDTWLDEYLQIYESDSLQAEEEAYERQRIEDLKEQRMQEALKQQRLREQEEEHERQKCLEEERMKQIRLGKERGHQRNPEEDQTKQRRLAEEREQQRRLEEEREEKLRLDQERKKQLRLQQEREEQKQLKEAREKQRLRDEDIERQRVRKPGVMTKEQKIQEDIRKLKRAREFQEKKTERMSRYGDKYNMTMEECEFF